MVLNKLMFIIGGGHGEPALTALRQLFHTPLLYLVLANCCLGGIWIGRPSTARMASRRPSLSVGCGWMVSIISSAVSSPRMATEYSLIRLVASGPMIWAPRISSYLPRITLVKPSV